MKIFDMLKSKIFVQILFKNDRIIENLVEADFEMITESKTRVLIDEQLRKVGWEADTNNLRYSNGTRPVKGRNLAIAEWKTNSEVGNNGSDLWIMRFLLTQN